MKGLALDCSALADDVARCNGVGSDDTEEGWREGCKTCLRRIAPRPEQCWMMEPPAIIAFECEFLIEPNSVDNHPPDRGRMRRDVQILQLATYCPIRPYR